MIGRQLAHYEILAKLGEGGMGVVYKARDTHLDRFLAIKLLPPEFVADPERKRRFTQEAKAASALNHPGIITIYDITQADGTDFIAMEHVQGKTLGDLIGRKGLRLKDTLNYGVQAAGALAKAHAAGIVHRDLKPPNIMVTDDGLVKVLDFGVAKLTMADGCGDVHDAPTHTMSVNHPLHTGAGKIVGTVAYMSPEQAEGKDVDARSDIFSFGALLYEMVTGTRAFKGTSSVLTLAAVINEEPTPPTELAAGVPRELERIILRCLRKDPARRFQFMADVAVELEEIKTESGTQIAAARGRAPARRTRWLIASAVAVSVAATAWLLWRKPVAGVPPPTVLPLTSLSGDERSPTLSPDGNQVAFVWGGEQGDNLDIYVMSVGAGMPLRLTTDPARDHAPAWSPDGSQIAFIRREGQKAAVYLTSPVSGPERKLAEVDDELGGDLIDFSSWAAVSWLPNGKGLVVPDRGGHRNGIVMIPLDHGDSKRLIGTPASAGEYLYPAVSPTASALAYALCASFANCDIYVIALAEDLTVSGAPTRLTRENSVVSGIAWTADGRSLIYGSGANKNKSYLWRVPVLDGPPERLELPGDHAVFPAISGASHTLAYTRLDSGADIWKLDEHGAHPFLPLSSTLDERHTQFSPDGMRIAFESNRLGKGAQLFVAHSDGTSVAAVSDGVKGTQGSPRWSPNSRSIVFDGQGEDGRQQVYVVDAAGGRPRVLASPGNMPSWSHDGNWVYFGVSGTDRSPAGIRRVPAAGGDAVQIADTGGNFPNPLESPDGKTLYYRRAVGAFSLLLSRPVGGGAERRILDSMSNGVHQYFPVEEGIYYVTRPDQKLPLACELRFLDFATGRHETLSRFEARYGAGLSVSKDRGTILYSGTPLSAGADLMLIRNFR